MKRIITAVLMLSMFLALAACGGGDNSQPTITTQILSNPVFDGDIERTPANDIITQGMSISTVPPVQSVFAGIDPVTLTETRAFLEFPLTGAGGVPGNAVIASASLDIFIKSIKPPTGTIPIRIDLVDFGSQDLLTTLFNPFDLTSPLGLPALASISTSIIPGDFGQHVSFNVTALMKEAQFRGLLNFQIRILEDLVTAAPDVLFEIDDSTATPADRAAFAPILTVTYF